MTTVEQKSVDVEVVLKTINKLLDTPLGNQIYAKDIRTLLDIVSLQTYPPIIKKGDFNDN